MLKFQQLDVYRCAVEFVACALELAESFPPGLSALKDQLKRASFSIPLNIAEASGKVREADRARYYAIARGSAMECAAVLDVAGLRGKLAERELIKGQTLLERIVSMLSKMCRG